VEAAVDGDHLPAGVDMLLALPQLPPSLASLDAIKKSALVLDFSLLRDLSCMRPP